MTCKKEKLYSNIAKYTFYSNLIISFSALADNLPPTMANRRGAPAQKNAIFFMKTSGSKVDKI